MFIIFNCMEHLLCIITGVAASKCGRKLYRDIVLNCFFDCVKITQQRYTHTLR
jgi:hypothetical protein